MGGGDAVPRFFIEPRECSPGESLTLSGEDARHISLSLRARPGERYTLCDACRYEYECVIRTISSDEVVFDVLSKKPCEAEPDVRVTLFQALVKGDKFDTIVQKAVELGANEIVPVLSERCVSRPDEKSLAKKRERWQKIAKSAAMQCARSVVPEIGEAVDFDAMLARVAEADCGFLCYETEPHKPLKQLFAEASREKKAETYCFFIGPEGGVSLGETEKANAAGVPLASLGKRILRTETAPLCVISAIMFWSDNLN